MIGREPEITINGNVLTPAQSMALRVALTSFVWEMQTSEDVLGADEHGRFMRNLYIDRGREVQNFMFEIYKDDHS